MPDAKIKTGLVRRHFEGWQAGAVALAIAGLGILLGTPRAVPPTELPQPLPDLQALAEARRADLARAERMRRADPATLAGPLYDVRVVGEALRRYGEADASRDRAALSAARDELVRAVRVVRVESGVEPLLDLRAFQLEAFLAGLSQWEATGMASDDLRQVGGDIVLVIERSGWVRPPRRFVADVPVRVALFKRRFAEVTALKEPELGLTLDEARALYGFFFLHPPPVATDRPDPGKTERATWEWLYRKAEELGAVDPAYPLSLARGIAQYRAGDARGAVLSFRDHLAKHPDGPYTLRARNHLAAALEAAELMGP